MQSPQDANRRPRANFCLHDNEKLARYLVSDFVSHFGAWKGLPGLDGLTYRPLDSVAASGDPASTYSETVKSGDLTVQLTWSGLGKPFCFALPPDKSATGKHPMPSLFVPCHGRQRHGQRQGAAGQSRCRARWRGTRSRPRCWRSRRRGSAPERARGRSARTDLSARTRIERLGESPRAAARLRSLPGSRSAPGSCCLPRSCWDRSRRRALADGRRDPRARRHRALRLEPHHRQPDRRAASRRPSGYAPN